MRTPTMIPRHRLALATAVIAALTSVASTALTAATIEFSKGNLRKITTVPAGTSIPDAWVPRLLISGPIIPGDERKFLATLNAAAAFEAGQLAANPFEAGQLAADPNLNSEWNVDTVWLNSNGGDIAVAMEIARLIRTNRLSTRVEDNAVCASACVLILAGGVKRTARDRAKIGLHRPYFTDPVGATGQGYEKFKTTYNEVVNAHRQFFGEMGISPQVLESMLQISSNDIRWITREDAKSMSLLGADPAYEEWRHAKRIATDGPEYVEWEDRLIQCYFRTNSDQAECNRALGPGPLKRPASR
jgi:Clp protease